MHKFLLILALISFSASSAPVYKCESNGKVTYSESACANGKALPDMNKPSEAEQRNATQLAENEKAIEKKLYEKRQKQEAKEEKERLRAATKSEAKDKKCAKLQQRMAWADEDARKSTGKKAEKAQLKSRRATEKYVLECKR